MEMPPTKKLRFEKHYYLVSYNSLNLKLSKFSSEKKQSFGCDTSLKNSRTCNFFTTLEHFPFKFQ